MLTKSYTEYRALPLICIAIAIDVIDWSEWELCVQNIKAKSSCVVLATYWKSFCLLKNLHSTLLSFSLQAPCFSIRMTNGFIDKEKQSELLLALAILKISAPIDE